MRFSARNQKIILQIRHIRVLYRERHKYRLNKKKKKQQQQQQQR